MDDNNYYLNKINKDIEDNKIDPNMSMKEYIERDRLNNEIKNAQRITKGQTDYKTIQRTITMNQNLYNKIKTEAAERAITIEKLIEYIFTDRYTDDKQRLKDQLDLNLKRQIWDNDYEGITQIKITQATIKYETQIDKLNKKIETLKEKLKIKK